MRIWRHWWGKMCSCALPHPTWLLTNWKSTLRSSGDVLLWLLIRREGKRFQDLSLSRPSVANAHTLESVSLPHVKHWKKRLHLKHHHALHDDERHLPLQPLHHWSKFLDLPICS